MDNPLGFSHDTNVRRDRFDSPGGPATSDAINTGFGSNGQRAFPDPAAADAASPNE